MIATAITSNSELIAFATKLDSESKEIVCTMNHLSTILKSVSSYDGIDISSVVNIFGGNLINLSTDFINISLNISNYEILINEFDLDNFDIGPITGTSNVNGALIVFTNSNDIASNNLYNNGFVIYSGVTAGVISQESNASSNA